MVKMIVWILILGSNTSPQAAPLTFATRSDCVRVVDQIPGKNAKCVQGTVLVRRTT